MSTDENSDGDRSTLSTNILIPVSTDKSALSWDGNDATILGMLYETGRYYRRKGLFQTLFENRAVALSNGRLAVEDPNAVHFVTGQVTDHRSFDDPCPPTLNRCYQYNREARTSGVTKLNKITAIPDEHKHTVILAVHCVQQEKSRLLHSLT